MKNVSFRRLFIMGVNFSKGVTTFIIMLVKNVGIATDFGRISWQEFKGGSDITEGGIMFVDRDKKSCAEPHRVHGSLLFKDSEPKEGEKRFV